MKYNRDTVKEWAGDSPWRALRADYQRFREQGHSGWGSEGFWALAIYRAQQALRKSQSRRLWAPAALLLAILRKALQIVTGLDLHPGADIGAGMLIYHGSQVRVIESATIGVDCTLSQMNTIGAGASGRPKIGDHVYVAPHACILGAVTIGDGATIAACSLVLSNVPAGYTAIGVPARIVPRLTFNPSAPTMSPRQARREVTRRPALRLVAVKTPDIELRENAGRRAAAVAGEDEHRAHPVLETWKDWPSRRRRPVISRKKSTPKLKPRSGRCGRRS